jgi:hypothetical protein
MELQQDLPSYEDIVRQEMSTTTEIKFGTSVKIKMLDEDSKQRLDPEDYFYLKDFENKIGTIGELKESRTGIVSYRVDFDENHFGYFYSTDFEILTQ